MTKNFRALLSISALALAVGLASSPAAFAQDNMSKDGMAKDAMSNPMSNDSVKKDA